MADAEDEEPTGAEQVADSPRERRLELIVTVLLGFSALMSAWCAFEASKFGGAQSDSVQEAGRLQVDSARADNRAGQLEQVDVATFMQWVNATAAGDSHLADFYRERFRDEFVPAFDAWLAADPLDHPEAPATPFDLPEYRPAKFVEADKLRVAGEEALEVGDDHGSTADKYVLTVVLFAAALFQLGIQSRIGVFKLRAALVGVAGTIVVGTTLWLLTFPRLW